MAIEFGSKIVSVFGNKRVVFGRIDASGLTSGAVESGLRYIDALLMTPTSYTTAATSVFKYTPNLSSASAASNGMIYITGATAADQFNVLAIGD